MPSPSSPTDAPNHYWTAEANDLVGGWIVTNCKKPLSQICIHKMVEGSPFCQNCWKRVEPGHTDYVIAECMTEADAIIIASVLNRAGVRRPCS